MKPKTAPLVPVPTDWLHFLIFISDPATRPIHFRVKIAAQSLLQTPCSRVWSMKYGKYRSAHRFVNENIIKEYLRDGRSQFASDED